MKISSGFLIAIILVSSSCKKESTTECPPSSESIDQYTPMSVGDYWVYEVFYVDSNGNDSVLNIIDSVYISNDTVIKGETYFVYKGTHFLFSKDPNTVVQILRDSSGVLVNENGKFYFSTSDFTNKYNENLMTSNGDTVFYQYQKMNSDIVPITLPAGTFNCLNSQMYLYHNNPRQQKNPKLYPFLYGNQVGLVLETVGYFSQLGYYERRLIDYQVAIAIP